MGTHGVASGKLRSGTADKRAEKSTVVRLPSSRALTLRNWPVSWRLIAVIVLALVMGLVFGGLRVSAAVGQRGRIRPGVATRQPRAAGHRPGAGPGERTGRDDRGLLRQQHQCPPPWYNVTDTVAARVRTLAAGIGGSFPANIQASVATVRSVITHHGLGELRGTAQASQDALAVIADYAAPIGDMITLNDQIAQGISDPSLVNDVRTLNSLALAKDQAAQQRALLYNALTQQFFADGCSRR